VITIAAIFNTGVPILIFLLILGLVVFVHEFGHYIMARRCGIFVEEFAMGMGPKILQFKGKKRTRTPREGEEDVTIYTLRALPIGGFCKMRGMEERIEDDPEAMNNKSVFDRILVIVGGSAMNFILALIIFSVLVFLTGYVTPTVTELVENSPAQHAGIQVGDRITHINGRRVGLWDNLRFTLDMNAGNPVDVRVNRGGERITLNMTPRLDENDRYIIGIRPTPHIGILSDSNELERATVFGSVGNATAMIGFQVRAPFRILAQFVSRQPVPEGAGVRSIIGIGGEVTAIYQEAIDYGILPTVLTMLSLAGIISVAIGTMNLLPIPALDGARLVFLVIEGIRRKPVSAEREGMVHMAGFVLLMVLLVVVAYRDIVNLIR